MNIEDKAPNTYLHEKYIVIGGVTVSVRMSQAHDLPTIRQLAQAYTAIVTLLKNGNKTKAANVLGIHRRTLYKRGDKASVIAP